MITIFKIVDSYSKDGRKNQLFTFMVDWEKKKKSREEGFKLPEGRLRSRGREKKKKNKLNNMGE